MVYLTMVRYRTKKWRLNHIPQGRRQKKQLSGWLDGQGIWSNTSDCAAFRQRFLMKFQDPRPRTRNVSVRGSSAKNGSPSCSVGAGTARKENSLRCRMERRGRCISETKNASEGDERLSLLLDKNQHERAVLSAKRSSSLKKGK